MFNPRNVSEDEKIQICQSDFRNALTKVFPSVSKKDELLYSKLENSLRKTRSHITDVNVPSSTKEPKENPNATPYKKK